MLCAGGSADVVVGSGSVEEIAGSEDVLVAGSADREADGAAEDALRGRGTGEISVGFCREIPGGDKGARDDPNPTHSSADDTRRIGGGEESHCQSHAAHRSSFSGTPRTCWDRRRRPVAARLLTAPDPSSVLVLGGPDELAKAGAGPELETVKLDGSSGDEQGSEQGKEEGRTDHLAKLGGVGGRGRKRREGALATVGGKDGQRRGRM